MESNRRTQKIEQLSLGLDCYIPLHVKGMNRFILESKMQEINLMEYEQSGNFQTLLTDIYNRTNGAYYSVEEYVNMRSKEERNIKFKKRASDIISLILIGAIIGGFAYGVYSGLNEQEGRVYEESETSYDYE